MWQLKFERSFRNIRIGFMALVLLTIVLSAGMFITSFILVKQIGTLQSFIPSLDLNQRMTAQILSLKLELTQYIAEGNQKNIENIIIPLKAIQSLTEDRANRTNNEFVKDNMLKANMKIENFLKEVKELPERQVVPKTKELINKVSEHLADPKNANELDSLIQDTVRVANAAVIISLIIAIFVGGGMFLGTVIYMYVTRKQMEKIDEVMSLSMVDEITRLYNRHYFEERMLESINRVQRFKKPMAVLFIKIEIPAGFNEGARNLIFKEIAGRLTKGTRAYDVNARFTEDIFASIIQEVEMKETGIVIKRLKNSFEQKEITGKTDESRSGFFSKLFGGRKTGSKHFSVYIKVKMGAILYREEKLGIGDIFSGAEVALKEAEISKDQIKIMTLRGEKEHGGKSK